MRRISSISILFVALLSTAHIRHALSIRCYQVDTEQLKDCTAAGMCEAISMPITEASNDGDEYNVTGAAYNVPDPKSFSPPFPPTLNMTAKFTTCYFAMLTHIPDASSPDDGPPGGLLSVLGGIRLPPSQDTDAPSSVDTDPEDYGMNMTDDGPGVAIFQGGGTADPQDPFHDFATCMDTWTTFAAELELLQPMIGGTNDLFYYCCTTTGCNYGPNGANPNTALPPPHPKHMYRPRPPPLSSPAPSPRDNQQHTPDPVDTGGDGAIIGLRVFLAALLVTVVAGGVWFFWKQRKDASSAAHSSAGGEGKQPASSEAAGLLTGHVASTSSQV